VPIWQESGPDPYLNLMDQYCPAGKVSRTEYAEINLGITSKEYVVALEAAHAAGEGAPIFLRPGGNCLTGSRFWESINFAVVREFKGRLQSHNDPCFSRQYFEFRSPVGAALHHAHFEF
jgi:hypothetical protein